MNRKDSLKAEGAEGLHVYAFVERVKLFTVSLVVQLTVICQKKLHSKERPYDKEDCYDKVACY